MLRPYADPDEPVEMIGHHDMAFEVYTWKVAWYRQPALLDNRAELIEQHLAGSNRSK